MNTGKEALLQHLQGHRSISQTRIPCANRSPLITSNTDPGSMQLVFMELLIELHLGVALLENGSNVAR